ncbi:MAG: hypothetical protein U0892_13805 [Pirellulales bacterium]
MSSIVDRFDMIEDATVDKLRQMSEWERLLIASQIWTAKRAELRAVIQPEHPDWSEQQVNREIAHRISGGLVPR